jgi:hypothetical protein
LSEDLNKKFNLVVTPPDQVNALSNEVASDNAKKDFTQARASMVSVVSVMAQAVVDLGAMAGQSQDVNYYIALASLGKTATDANLSLLRVHKQLQELDAPESNKTNAPGELHNHIHFPSMSTNDLKEALKTLKNENPHD